MTNTNPFQKTLKETFSIEGVGLHTGKSVNLNIMPASENHGFKFRRTDLLQSPIIEVFAEHVIDTSRGTKLQQNGATIGTIEHLMAALVGSGIDNALIEVDNEEMPILDGSSLPYIENFKKIGIENQRIEKKYFEVPNNIIFRDEQNKIEMIAMPLDDYRLTVMVDYNSPILGSQHASITDLTEFEKEIAPSRTFCFWHELELLHKNGLIKGGDLDNAIVIVDKEISKKEMEAMSKLFKKPSLSIRKEGILDNIELRYQNEPARHKLLDLIGDLALVGSPLKAQILAARPGHKANVEFAKKIRQTQQSITLHKVKKSNVPEYNPDQAPQYTYKEVQKILPHKFPFLLVDKILSIKENVITAIKNVTGDEYFFQGHFPDEPIMPGVLQLEAMAQVGGVLILHDKPNPEKWSTYFAKIENAKFKGKVVPGDSLIIQMVLIAPIRRGICFMKGKTYVGSQLVSEADMTAPVLENK